MSIDGDSPRFQDSVRDGDVVRNSQLPFPVRVFAEVFCRPKPVRAIQRYEINEGDNVGSGVEGNSQLRFGAGRRFQHDLQVAERVVQEGYVDFDEFGEPYSGIQCDGTGDRRGFAGIKCVRDLKIQLTGVTCRCFQRRDVCPSLCQIDGSLGVNYSEPILMVEVVPVHRGIGPVHVGAVFPTCASRVVLPRGRGENQLQVSPGQVRVSAAHQSSDA